MAIQDEAVGCNKTTTILYDTPPRKTLAQHQRCQYQTIILIHETVGTSNPLKLWTLINIMEQTHGLNNMKPLFLEPNLRRSININRMVTIKIKTTSQANTRLNTSNKNNSVSQWIYPLHRQCTEHCHQLNWSDSFGRQPAMSLVNQSGHKSLIPEVDCTPVHNQDR
jgi:hypothetical protein